MRMREMKSERVRERNWEKEKERERMRVKEELGGRMDRGERGYGSGRTLRLE